MKVVYTSVAEAQLTYILDYLGDTFAAKTTQKVQAKVRAFEATVVRAPWLYPAAPPPLDFLRKATITPLLIAYYHVDLATEQITLEGFRDTRQDPDRWAATLTD
jgi:plasmid stabilization system protein ParE